jgi:hypothetical protein
MKLYHGSNVEVNQPRLQYQTRGLDFGSGFYLTSKEEQAVNFSNNVYKRAKRLKVGNIGIPTVSVFEFDDTAAMANLETLIFYKPDCLWLDFVRQNRRKEYSGRVYDVIIGPVANDRVFPTIQALERGILSIEAALVELKSQKLFDQYCIATEKALSLLSYLEHYKMGG